MTSNLRNTYSSYLNLFKPTHWLSAINLFFIVYGTGNRLKKVGNSFESMTRCSDEITTKINHVLLTFIVYGITKNSCSHLYFRKDDPNLFRKITKKAAMESLLRKASNLWPVNSTTGVWLFCKISQNTSQRLLLKHLRPKYGWRFINFKQW